MNAIPCTAVIGEIRYAESGEILLIPKKGKWKFGDEPFPIKKDELKKYITINHTEGEKKENPFKKVYLNWPLTICKKGIEFVDSPGLDDPDCHDNITKGYLPSADAIIYCMHSSVAYSGKDRNIIEELRALGHTSILFVLTNYDLLIANDEMIGATGAKDFVELMYKRLIPLTDLGKNGIFFVNSIAAIKGKMTSNQELLKSSNFPELEKKIENFLVNQKGRLKLFKSLYSTKKVNRDNWKDMQDSIAVLEKDNVQLKQMVKEAQDPLNQAKSKGELIRTQVKGSIQEILNNAQDKGSLFLMNCISNIDSWVEEHTPEKGISVNPLKLKSSIKEYSQSCLEHVKFKMEEESKYLSINELAPMIKNNFQSLFRSMEDKIRAYNRDLLDVRIKLDLASDADKIAEEKNPGTFSRLAGVTYTLMTFDLLGGAVGIAFGLNGLLRTFAAQLVAGIVLGIASLFTPVGLPAFIIGAVIASLTGAGWSLLSIKKQIKKKIAEKTKETLQSEDKKQEILLRIKEAVSKILNNVQKEVDDAVDTDINSYQKLLDDAKTKYSKDNSLIQNKLNLYKELIKVIEPLADKLDGFGQKIGV